ncbi:hypothetical protein [Methylobacterium sp. WSM2598]|uniref:hypothetical protein n=1 Tax=Methylobacterium sp. WSM2598 TaxID=398261 RepID=UPI0003805645|nr:hypothetical protein [Methylobacterium sp. WSM2598]
MSSALYHHTDTARLAWILRSGQLRPGSNQIPGLPRQDFLWATTAAAGDATASASRDALRAGRTRAVRFGLRADDFLAWPEIVGQHPESTVEHVAHLERLAAGRSSPRTWRCRSTPLPSSAWLGVETKAYADKRWIALPADAPVDTIDASTLGMWIEGRYFNSRAEPGLFGITRYDVAVGVRHRNSGFTACIRGAA